MTDAKKRDSGCALYDAEHWRAPGKPTATGVDVVHVDMLALATSDRFIYTYRLLPGKQDQQSKRTPDSILGEAGGGRKGTAGS